MKGRFEQRRGDDNCRCHGTRDITLTAVFATAATVRMLGCAVFVQLNPARQKRNPLCVIRERASSAAPDGWVL